MGKKKRGKGNKKSQGQRAMKDSQVGGPTVVLVRHGKSEAQAAGHKGLDRHSDQFLDCKLAKSGVDQAKMLRPFLSEISPPLIYVSPLTRAIQTYSYMRNGPDFPTTVIADPRISELSEGNVPENTGRSEDEIKADWVVMQMEDAVNEIDFSAIQGDDPWWNSSKSRNQRNQNIQEFLNDIQSRQEPIIVVVCHYNVIRRMTQNRVRPSNCVAYTCKMMTDGVELFLQE